MQNDSDNSPTTKPVDERLARAIAGSLRQEWPYMSRESREKMAKEYPDAFRVSGLKMEAPQRPIPKEEEFDE